MGLLIEISSLRYVIPKSDIIQYITMAMEANIIFQEYFCTFSWARMVDQDWRLRYQETGARGIDWSTIL